MAGAKLDQSRLKKTGFYKKRILVIQENFKLFTVIVSVVTLVMLILNIVNACTGSVGLGWTIFLNLVWIACVGGFVVYVLIATKQKRDSFGKIDEISYGDLDSDYALCEIIESVEPLTKGNEVRLYDNERYYCLTGNGVREKRNTFWTKYNFKQDFGMLYLDKSVFRMTEQDGNIVLEGESDKIYLRRKLG